MKTNKKSFIFLSLLLVISLAACSSTTSTSVANPSPAATPTSEINPTSNSFSESGMPALENPSLESLQQSYEKIYEKVLPSVVNILVTERAPALSSSIPNLPFELPNEDLPQERLTALGSGFIWDTQGHIVTNNHVVEGAESIMVTFADGSGKRATLVGTDTDSDLAVIKVDASDKLVPIQVTDSTQVKVGQIAIAIGQPAGLQGSMTVGIISGLGRSLGLDSITSSGAGFTIPDVIQTDAPISPGNSGGPLVDINGRLIGVTTAIESPSQGYTSIGYVVPSIIVQKVVPALISKGSYEHAWLGITGRSMTTEIAEAMKLDPDQRGALVVEVDPDGPSAKAGLKASTDEITLYGQTVEIGGDIIIDIDGYPIKEFEDLAAYLARYGEVGKTVQLTVLRNGKEMKVSVTLMARPTSKSVQKTTAKSWLGITGITLDAELISAISLPEGTKGVLTIEVNENSPAAKAGIRAGTKTYIYNGKQIKIGGDVIAKFDNVNITTIGQLRSIVENVQPGTKVKLGVIRDGKTQVIEVTLEANPAQ